MPVEVEDEAPDFELPGRFDRESGQYRRHRLSASLEDGPVILHFFPAPFTSTCEEQMCAVRDSVDMYLDAGITVWGITAHAPSIIRSWARQHRFGVPILSDFDRGVSLAYVGLYEPREHLGVALCSKRGVIAIDPESTVRHVWIGEDPDVAPPHEEITGAIRSVGAVPPERG